MVGKISLNANGNVIPRKFALEALEEADSNYAGFCVACGATKDGCEPDARRYQCDECDLHTVFGAGEIALMGWIT